MQKSLEYHLPTIMGLTIISSITAVSSLTMFFKLQVRSSQGSGIAILPVTASMITLPDIHTGP